MANHLRVAMIELILKLHGLRWSNRRIAGELGIHRETVARHLRLAGSKPATASPGSDESLDWSKPAKAPPGSGSDPPAVSLMDGAANNGDLPALTSSECEPYRELIKAKLGQELSAKRIHQDLVADHHFPAKYHSVRRFVKRLGASEPLPFRRLECAPGEEAQVDFGTAAAIVGPDGKRRRPHVLRVVLSHSRKAYSEAVLRQTTDNFLLCLENAFWHFGGVPKTLVLDNLRAAVTNPDWFDPDINPKVRSFAEHYGIAVLPTKSYTPRHKGKVERGIGYVKDNALKGRVFNSLADQNRHLLEWEQSVADTRIHGTTRKQVGKVFADVERSALQPLPNERFPLFHEAQRKVHRDGHVEVDKSYYSVPPEYLGRRVWVRWDSRLVRIFNNKMQQITLHAKDSPGRFSTNPKHIVEKKRSRVERGATWMLQKTQLIGPHSGRWAESVIEARGVEGVRVLLGLISLAKKHPSESIELACETAVTYGAHRLRTIRELIKRQAPKQKQFDFLDEHPIIRSLSDYGDLVRNSFRRER